MFHTIVISRGELHMDTSMITYISAVVIIFMIGKIFIKPIKNAIKLLINSLLGGVIIYVINLIGGAFSFALGLNIFTSIFVGILGIPGAILLVIIKCIV